MSHERNHTVHGLGAWLLSLSMRVLQWHVRGVIRGVAHPCHGLFQRLAPAVGFSALLLLWLRSHCMDRSHCVHRLSVDGHWGCSHLLAAVNDAHMRVSVRPRGFTAARLFLRGFNRELPYDHQWLKGIRADTLILS